MLASYNITAETMGCEIRASMDVVELPQVRERMPVLALPLPFCQRLMP